MVGVVEQEQCASELAHPDLYNRRHVILLLIGLVAQVTRCSCDTVCCPLSYASASQVERFLVCRKGVTLLKHRKQR